MLQLMVSWPVYLGVKPHHGPKTRLWLLSDSCGFVHVGCPLWQEDGSIVYICCWPLPVQSVSGLSPMGLVPYFTVSDLRWPQPGGPGPHIYIPQEWGGPIIPPSTGFTTSAMLIATYYVASGGPNLKHCAQNHWVFGLYPSSSILETRKHNISEFLVSGIPDNGWSTKTQ
jgi:hypothetical protein